MPAGVADRESLPGALTVQGGANPSETRGAAWAAEGAAAAALAEVERPTDEGPDSRKQPLQLGVRGGAAAGIDRTALPRVQPAAAAAGTKAASGSVSSTRTVGTTCKPFDCLGCSLVTAVHSTAIGQSAGPQRRLKAGGTCALMPTIACETPNRSLPSN